MNETTTVTVISPVTLSDQVNGPADKLARLADYVRETYPKAVRAYESFNEYRFRIGLAMICARELLAMDSTKNLIPGAVHFPSSGQVINRRNQGLTKVEDANAKGSTPNFSRDDAGLMVWAREQFPHISYSTLSRYRAYAEHKALPRLIEQRQQLELPLENLDPQAFDNLPEEKRAAVVQILNQATDAKELALTLRSQGGMAGNPDHWGLQGHPEQGGARKPSPRRSKDQIKFDDFKLEAQIWESQLDKVIIGMTSEFAGRNGVLHYWDLLDDRKLEALKLAIKDLYQLLLECQSNKRQVKNRHITPQGLSRINTPSHLTVNA